MKKGELLEKYPYDISNTKEKSEELFNVLDTYHKGTFGKWPIGPMSWLGVGMLQVPSDLIAFQEIAYKVHPELLIEVGTGGGGSTYFYYSILDMLKRFGHFKDFMIITIDINDNNIFRDIKVPCIKFLKGDSTNLNIFNTVKSYWKENISTMVILDSDHSAPHVIKEIELYSSLVSENSYIVVQDTIIDYFDVVNGKYDYDRTNNLIGGPLNAVLKFLDTHNEFEIDREPERWLINQSPCGYLKRNRGDKE